MNLLECEVCHGQVAADAAKCPHCGTPHFRKQSIVPRLFVAALVLIVLYVLMKGGSSPPADVQEAARPRAPDDPSTSARGACMVFVKQRLHDPDSAEFPPSPSTSVTKREAGMWLVRMPVRARNSFNASRLKTFDCLMSYRQSDGTWSALAVSESR